ncbi:hypothetical protein [Roseateles chitinivorans]|uniref:hypothetical protein n=1 Tax=Roseateles chitinivorans TaxID=2917965 RepID=UPI003D67A013
MKPARRSAHQPSLIPPRNRHLRQPRSTSPAAGPTAGPSRWDSWLSRGASVAQIVGVVLALAGLFYTVIPLYQKAAVDEQLARREAELKMVETTLAEGKAEVYRLRRDSYVRVATRAAAEECSDVFRGLMDLPAGTNESEHEYRLRLDINVVDCVDRYLAKADEMKELNPADLATWRSWASGVVEPLEAQRQKANAEIEALPAKAARDPSMLDAEGEFAAGANRLFTSMERILFPTPKLRKERDRQMFQRRLQSTRERIARDYRQVAAAQLRQTLEPKAWRDERAKKEAAVRAGAEASSAGQ